MDYERISTRSQLNNEASMTPVLRLETSGRTLYTMELK
jgi:hypothetical protein